jgi:serine phosphatase RsbU (regulator of sigma subunit)/CHASE2 domain-containing sensor protein
MLLSAVFAAAMLIPDPGPLSVMRLAAFDYYQVWLPRTRQSAPAMIVAVDDESLVRIGQWPWPREIIARLIDRMAARQPAAIAVDLLFTEPDRSSPERIAEALRARDPVIADHLSRMRSNDDILAEAIGRAPVVLGVAGVEQASINKGAHAVSANVVGPALPLHRYPGVLRSLPRIDDAARGHGMINAEPERGIVRRVPIVAYLGADPMLTLALESFRVAAGLPSFTISHAAGLARIQVGDVEVPAQEDGKAWVHFSRHDPSRFVSAADVLEGRDDPSLLEGKIAMLGVTALALLDQHTTARGEQLPGIEIHAQLVENIFEGALLTRPVWGRYVEALAFLLGAAVLIMRVPRVRPRRSFVLLMECWFAFAAAGFAAYVWGRMLFDPTAPIVGVSILYGLMLAATLVGLDLQRRELSARLATEREAAARVTGELEAARRIQTGMLPTRESVLQYERRVELFAHMSAAREVGGDLYDFFSLPGDRFVILVGDVSGKGLPAAMFMAVSKALAKSCALRSNAGPAAIITMLNQEISRENPEQMFVTMVALVMNLKTGELEYCNAGHEPPLLSRRSGEILTLDDGGGPPVCVIEDYAYEEARVMLQPRDVLVLASDGLTEAMNRDGALYGRERLKVLLDSPLRRDVDPTVLGNEILSAIKGFEAGSEPADDQTLLLVSWRGAA